MELGLRRLMAVEKVQVQVGSLEEGAVRLMFVQGLPRQERSGWQRRGWWFTHVPQFISRGRLAVKLTEIRLQCSSLAKALLRSCEGLLKFVYWVICVCKISRSKIP